LDDFFAYRHYITRFFRLFCLGYNTFDEELDSEKNFSTDFPDHWIPDRFSSRVPLVWFLSEASGQ
jgi:hypothetical protein